MTIGFVTLPRKCDAIFVLQILTSFFSETTGPIEVKFRMDTYLEDVDDHMTKMTARHTYIK